MEVLVRLLSHLVLLHCLICSGFSLTHENARNMSIQDELVKEMVKIYRIMTKHILPKKIEGENSNSLPRYDSVEFLKKDIETLNEVITLKPVPSDQNLRDISDKKKSVTETHTAKSLVFNKLSNKLRKASNDASLNNTTSIDQSKTNSSNKNPYIIKKIGRSFKKKKSLGSFRKTKKSYNRKLKRARMAREQSYKLSSDPSADQVLSNDNSDVSNMLIDVIVRGKILDHSNKGSEISSQGNLSEINIRNIPENFNQYTITSKFESDSQESYIVTTVFPNLVPDKQQFLHLNRNIKNANNSANEQFDQLSFEKSRVIASEIQRKFQKSEHFQQKTRDDLTKMLKSALNLNPTDKNYNLLLNFLSQNINKQIIQDLISTKEMKHNKGKNISPDLGIFYPGGQKSSLPQREFIKKYVAAHPVYFTCIIVISCLLVATILCLLVYCCRKPSQAKLQTEVKNTVFPKDKETVIPVQKLTNKNVEKPISNFALLCNKFFGIFKMRDKIQSQSSKASSSKHDNAELKNENARVVSSQLHYQEESSKPPSYMVMPKKRPSQQMMQNFRGQQTSMLNLESFIVNDRNDVSRKKSCKELAKRVLTTDDRNVDTMLIGKEWKKSYYTTHNLERISRKKLVSDQPDQTSNRKDVIPENLVKDGELNKSLNETMPSHEAALLQKSSQQSTQSYKPLYEAETYCKFENRAYTTDSRKPIPKNFFDSLSIGSSKDSLQNKIQKCTKTGDRLCKFSKICKSDEYFD